MERELIPIADAGLKLGIGRTKVYELLGTGKLKAKKIGVKTLVVADSLRELVDSLPDASIRGKRAPSAKEAA
jgi:hypothetical protein